VTEHFNTDVWQSGLTPMPGILPLLHVKSSNVVFSAKNVVISGVFVTTRVVISEIRR
jgi:hypothetical protein